MECLFILDQKERVEFSVGYIPLLIGSDSVFLRVHKSEFEKKEEKKTGERMIVILHHKAC